MTRPEPKRPEMSQIMPKALIGPIYMGIRTSCLGVPGIACIYRITCKPDGRSYIGQTTDMARRWLEHQTSLWERRHGNPGLQAAFNQFGPLGFHLDVLETLPRRYNEGTYAIAEQRHMDLHGWDRLFNVRPAGTNNWLRRTAAGRTAGQAAKRRKAVEGKHKRNKHHF